MCSLAEGAVSGQAAVEWCPACLLALQCASAAALTPDRAQLYAEAVPRFREWLLAAMDPQLRDALLRLRVRPPARIDACTAEHGLGAQCDAAAERHARSA